MIKVAPMLRAHFKNILTHLTHWVTNAMTDGLNAKTQSDDSADRKHVRHQLGGGHQSVVRRVLHYHVDVPESHSIGTGRGLGWKRNVGRGL
jgi:hypothetical protein